MRYCGIRTPLTPPSFILSNPAHAALGRLETCPTTTGSWVISDDLCYLRVYNPRLHITSLQKHPFLLALHFRERFVRRNVCDTAVEIQYWWRKSMFLGAKRPHGQWRRARRNGCFRGLANYLPQGCVPPYYVCLFWLCALFFGVTFHGDLKSGIGTNLMLLWHHFSSYWGSWKNSTNSLELDLCFS